MDQTLVSDSPARPPGDDSLRPDMREAIHDYAGTAAAHCSLIQTYAEIGDDTGLEYAIRRFLTYARAIAGTFKDMTQDKPEATE